MIILVIANHSSENDSEAIEMREAFPASYFIMSKNVSHFSWFLV